MPMPALARLVVTLAASALLAPPLTACRAAPDARTARVDALFERWDGPDSPGCAVGVVQAGRFVHARGYGMANLEYDLPITTRSVFRTGSVSKQFTAMAVLLAAEQGHLTLDDEVRRWIPELHDYGRPITIRHLLHHTSGIRDYLTLMEVAGVRDEDYYTNAQLMQALARQRTLNFEPGSEYLYSNAGYWLLSQIVERATGRTLAQFAKTHIFDPLEMADTHFHDDHRRIVPRRATGYRPRDEGGYEIDQTTLDMVGDGGVFTTLDDMLKWERNLGADRLGGPDLMEALLTPGRLADGTTQDYALGLRIATYRGLRTIGHGGAFVGFRANLVRFPDQQFAVITLCNTSEADPAALDLQIADVYLADAFSEADPPAALAADTLPAGLIGWWWNPSTDGVAEIAVEDGQAVFRDGETPWQLAPGGSTPLEARRGAARAALTLHEGFPRRLEVRYEGQRPFVFEAFERLAGPAERIADYAGTYFSPELDAHYRVVPDGDRLLLDAPFQEVSLLQPMFGDVFRYARGSVVFTRDEAGRVSGLRLAAGRARNFQFARQAGAGGS